MASFTDQVPKFNPYVQQLPVEAMVEVGMEKQRRYDEGLQRIQSSIDKIATLDIVKPQHQDYVRQQLDSLSKDLRGVAAGDFSNPQLVNTVSGMASKIGKDPIVQNAVISTASFRKEQTNIEALRKDKRTAIANDVDYSKRVDSWFNDPDLKSPFKEKYFPYNDLTKKWYEVFKNLHSDLREEDITHIMTYKPDGTVDTEKVAAAMSRISREHISPEKIETAIRASLTPDDYHQLRIDANYRLASYDTPEKVQTYALTKYDQLTKLINGQLKVIDAEIALQSGNSTYHQQLINTKDQLTKKLGYLDKELAEELAWIEEDIETAKAEIYKNGAIAQFASANSWLHEKMNSLSNPYREDERWQLNYDLDVKKYNLDVAKANWQKEKEEKELRIKEKEAGDANPPSSEPFRGFLDESTVVDPPLLTMYQDETAIRTDVLNKLNEVVQSTGSTMEEVRAAMNRYLNGDEQWYKIGTRELSIHWRDYITGIAEQEARAERLKTVRNAIVNNVVETGENKIHYLTAKERARRTLPESVSGIYNGKSYTFSQQEMVDYFFKKSINNKVWSYELNDREIAFEQILNYKVSEVSPYPGVRVKQDINTNKDSIAKISEKAQSILAGFAERVAPEIEAAAKAKSGVYAPTIDAIEFPAGDKGTKLMRDTQAGLSTVLAYYERLNDTTAGAEEVSPKEIRKVRGWLEKDEGNLFYHKVRQGSKVTLVVIKGNEQVNLPLTRELVDEFERKNIFTGKPLTDMQMEINMLQQNSKNGTTNLNNHPSGAYFQRYYFKNTNLLVKADLTVNKANPAFQYLTLMVFTPQGWKTVTRTDLPVNLDRIPSYLASLTTEDIKNLFLTYPGLDEETKAVITALK